MDALTWQIKVKELHSKTQIDRNQIQDLALEMSKIYKCIWLRFSVGTGKTRAAGLIGNSKKCLYISSRKAHLENARLDLESHNIDFSQWIFSTNKSFHKYKNDFDVVFINEADESLTENNLQNFADISTEKIVFLTADANTLKSEYIKLFSPKVWKIELKDLIRWGLFPELDIILYKVNLDNKNKYIKHKKMLVTEKQMFSNLLFLSDVYKKNAEEQKHKAAFWYSMLKKHGLVIKTFLNNVKRNVVKKIFDKYYDRTIVFCNSVTEAKKYPYSIHSEQSTDLNNKLIERFNNYEINNLANVGIITRDINLYNLNTIIIGAFNKEPIALYQQTGRLRNSKIRPKLIIPYVDGTSELDTIKKFLDTYDLNIYAQYY